MDTAVASKLKVGDRVTGTGIASTATVTVQSIASTYAIQVSEAVEIDDGVTLTFTPPYYYRWGIDSGDSIHKLSPGMLVKGFLPDMSVIPSDVIDSSTISNYEDTTTYTTEIHNEDGGVQEIENTVVNFSVPALDPLGYKPTITNGLVTKQLGNITFDTQMINDLSGIDANFFAYGPNAVKTIHNSGIILTDLKVALTEVTTTTTSAVNNSTTIPVAERKGTVVNVSTISGIGIDSSVANPTVASATDEGAGNWTASAAQTLESGVTLTVGGTGKVATITGNIEFINIDDTNFSLYFDVERFLTVS